MKFVLVTLTIVFSHTVFAQKSIEERTLIVKGDPLALINNFTFPLVQFSAEKRLSKHFSIAPELGVQLYNSKLSSIDSNLTKWNGFKLGIEGRYYGLFRSKYRNRGPYRAWAEKYLSLSIFYRQNRDNAQVFYHKPDDTTRYNDCFVFSKKAWGINLIYGVQINKKRFVAEFYGGIGFLNRRTKNYSREYDDLTDELIRDSDVTVAGIKKGAALRENSGTIGNIIVGIRLGMRL
ncbi:MAG: hypothetical protein QM802_13405 [Agriterribacter sp.]